MKIKLLVILVFMHCLEISALAAEKKPFPDKFSDRLSVVINACGSIPANLVIVISLMFMCAAAAVIYYLIKDK